MANGELEIHPHHVVVVHAQGWTPISTRYFGLLRQSTDQRAAEGALSRSAIACTVIARSAISARSMRSTARQRISTRPG